VQVVAYQTVDATVESCREQQTLRIFRGLAKNFFNMLQEPKFSHVVGFVENGYFYFREVDVA
jgi:hypothetical protein